MEQAHSLTHPLYIFTKRYELCRLILNLIICCSIYSFFRIITSLPIYTQRLLVLLFGTFRVIASNSEKASTGMTSEALGVSVAPSFFHSCVSDGKTAKMEDVMKFKVSILERLSQIDQSRSTIFRNINTRFNCIEKLIY